MSKIEEMKTLSELGAEKANSVKSHTQYQDVRTQHRIMQMSIRNNINDN
mgnify:FL=1